MNKVAIVSLGWLGQKIHYDLCGQYEMVGSYHSIPKRLQGEFQFDINRDSSHPQFANCDSIILNLPPSVLTNVEVVEKFVQTYSDSLIIFVSSTGVYNQEGVSTEVSTIDPTSDRQKKLLKLETAITEHAENHVIIRSAGQYGGKRHPGKYMAGKEGVSAGDSPVNLVSDEDLVRVIRHSLKSQEIRIINAVNSHHPSKKDYYSSYCLRHNLTPPKFENGGAQRIIETKYSQFEIKSELP